MVADIDAADVGQLMGRAHAKDHQAGGFDRDLIEHARGKLPSWFEVSGDGRQCPLTVDLASPKSTRVIRVAATARCAGEPAELALRWRASGHGLDVHAAGTLVKADGTRAAIEFDAAAPRQVVQLRRAFPWTQAIVAAAVFIALLLSWRRLRSAR